VVRRRRSPPAADYPERIAASRSDRNFPLGERVTLEALDRDPHPVLARLREQEPVSWVPALAGWLVTRHDLALAAMRDAASFTVDDPRFSTAQVIGPSMLSLDGAEHARHRAPFVGPFRAAAVRERFGPPAAALAAQLVAALAPAGGAELRRAFAGPMAVSIVTRALGLDGDEVDAVRSWYEAIVASVTSITAGRGATAAGKLAFASLQECLQAVLDGGRESSLLASAAADSSLSREQIVSNAAVMLFGGIETTESMIANAVMHLLVAPQQLERVRQSPQLLDAAIDESLRLEPAAAVIDRYATVDTELGGARVAAGELVRISISAANRDPAVFADPDAFELTRSNHRRHLAFAQGPHVCVGVHLARLETRAALQALLEMLPGLRLDPARTAQVRGLVFRKPPRLQVLWS
jgi:cytochrome P450